jgi:hypothetical protein
MMSLRKAEEVAVFCQVNGIKTCEIMGGEFFTNPQWEEIVPVLAGSMEKVRLVSNGDWAANSKTALQVTGMLASLPQVRVGISRDKWHTNAYVEAACRFLLEAGINYRVTAPEEGRDDSIVPLGRAEGGCHGIYSMMSTYCSNPTKHYSLLIDEVGDIFKCGMGVWKYATVGDYLDGGFAKRFRQFNIKFYNIFIANCAVCHRMEQRVLAKTKTAMNEGSY